LDTNSFLTLAELSLALIGFSALVAAFERDRAPDLITRFRTRVLVEIALTAFALSLLPFLLSSFGVSGEQLWRSSSLGGALLVGGHISYAGRRSFKLARVHHIEFSRPPLYAAGVASALVAVNVVNATALLWMPSAGPVACLVAAQLGAACAFFIQVFFHVVNVDDPAA
jgi:hypothetical protein